MIQVHPFIILIASIFTSNMVFSNFLGMCSFIAVSKEIPTALGLGIAVTMVLSATTVLNYFVYWYILLPLGLEYLMYILFILVIAAFVQLLEMVMDRYLPALYYALGIFLPLITVIVPYSEFHCLWLPDSTALFKPLLLQWAQV